MYAKKRKEMLAVLFANYFLLFFCVKKWKWLLVLFETEIQKLEAEKKSNYPLEYEKLAVEDCFLSNMVEQLYWMVFHLKKTV